MRIPGGREGILSPVKWLPALLYVRQNALQGPPTHVKHSHCVPGSVLPRNPLIHSWYHPGRSVFSLSHFIDGEIEAQRGSVTCTRSHTVDVDPRMKSGVDCSRSCWCSSRLLQTCSVEPGCRAAPWSPAPVRKKINCFLLEQHLQDLCPRGQETENLFSSGFGEGESAFGRPWHFFEVSFYLKHSCKFGIGFGGCVYFEMKTWF